jgi:hypothetical protein
MQDDRHGKFFLVGQVPREEGLDRPGDAVQPADLVAGLRLVQLHQLDRAVGRAGEPVQHLVEIGMVLFEDFKPRVEAWIGGGQLGKVAVVLPAVVAMQVSDQRSAKTG